MQENLHFLDTLNTRRLPLLSLPLSEVRELLGKYAAFHHIVFIVVVIAVCFQEK